MLPLRMLYLEGGGQLNPPEEVKGPAYKSRHCTRDAEQIPAALRGNKGSIRVFLVAAGTAPVPVGTAN